MRGQLQRRGYDLIRVPNGTSVGWTLAELIRDTGPDVLVDVGANRGDFARMLRALGYRGPVVSFEPTEEDAAALERQAEGDPSWTVSRLALGDRNEVRQLRVGANSQLNSFLEYRREIGETVERPVEVARLDRVLDEFVPGARAVFLKVDTQGWDMRVLEGATGILDRVAVVQVELALRPHYEEHVDWLALLVWMRRRGFEPVALFPRNSREGPLAEADCLFRRTA